MIWTIHTERCVQWLAFRLHIQKLPVSILVAEADNNYVLRLFVSAPQGKIHHGKIKYEIISSFHVITNSTECHGQMVSTST
jgi:hypothetical protein